MGQVFLVDLIALGTTLDLPATHQDCAHTENHRSNSVIKFKAPVVDGNFVRSHHRRDHPGEGTDEDVRHEVEVVEWLIGPAPRPV